jgi:hypothetical protein
VSNKKTVIFQSKNGLTKRAADWWDSAPFSGIFLASGFSLLSKRIPARPHAGNANRWAAKSKIGFDLQGSFGG